MYQVIMILIPETVGALSMIFIQDHIEYWENKLNSLDISKKPIRGNLTAHAWTLSHEFTQLTVSCHWVSLCTGWNDKIVALEKTTWFHFHLMKTGFLFFVADHLLLGQLCTNPKSNWSLLSCLKVTQCSTSEIGDVPLYNSCSLPIQVMTTEPLPAPSKCKSGWFNVWGHSSIHRTTLWRWWSGRTPSGKPGPRSSSKRSRQSLMKLPSGLFGRLPEIQVSHTQLWMHVWRRTWSVGPTGTRQARSWLRRQRTSG